MADKTVAINGIERSVEFSTVYTRKVDREFNAVLFVEAETFKNKEGDMEFKINPINVSLANDYLISAVTNLTTKDIDNLTISDYDELLKMAQALKTPSKKQW